MASSKLKLKQSMSAEGIVAIDEGVLTLEFEDLGIKSFEELFTSFDGQLVKISVTTIEEILE